ncbi:Y-family DNA polymerase [Endozoicomonas sp. 4G]|uniref:Y-family DNA polymerase n=1 Tax=Endozoicomonas sp. 4G TaxID=2872754 RepID=UPI002078F93A|nr:Y-family DNA polymerase [Endozoicomonas sp. 4G]
MKPVIGLCDANNFYVSCERLFNPKLLDIPVAVASNNDGCLVARSAEVKAMGIKMGTPVFKVKHLIESGQLIVLSSNYTLYGDLSGRFHSILEQFSPRVSVYSIDEAFIDLSGMAEKIEHIGMQMKNRVAQWVGLPVCVGVSSTKTLAKLANYGAKKFPATGGVVDLTNTIRQQRLMAITPVAEVWGVGRKIAKRLQSSGIHSALDLARSNRTWIKRNFSVVLERTVCELQGELCIPFDEETSGNKHQIVVSRSFGERVTDIAELHSALSHFATRACEKLREQNKFASTAIAFIRTDPFKNHLPQSCQSVQLGVPAPTNDTRQFLRQLEPALRQIFRQGFEYKKAGFMLIDLCNSEGFQGDLISGTLLPDTSPLMSVMDSINQRFGANTLHPAALNLGRKQWHMRQESLSPKYTTCWNDIVKVHCR